MPFRLKLKKSRHYSVVSKSLFVVSVELLDGLVVECTLAADSLAQECLEHVCQRLCIQQPELMGLRAAGAAGAAGTTPPRWVDLSRPLARQLRKLRSPCVQLRLMHYPSRGSPPPLDETTRYHYFLQLKADLVDGRLWCDCRQAVLLLAYSHQAEYGDHQERHTVDYFKDLIAFPKAMRDGGRVVDGSQLADAQLEMLIAAVIHHHQTLRGLTQTQAEEGFISACQSLSGYGQETFAAKEHSRQNDVEIAISLTGITITQENSDTPKFYKWTDIKNVINHKRNFSIECQNTADNTSFVFSSAEDGKYVWRMCVLQHTFFMKHQQAVHIPGDQTIPAAQLPQPKFQNDGISDSRDDLDCVALDKEYSMSVPGLLETSGLKMMAYGGSQQGLQSEAAQPLSNTQRALSTSCLDLTVSNNQLQSQNEIDKLKALLPTYRAAPDYDTAVQQKYSQQLPTHVVHANPMGSAKPFIYGSQPEIHRPIHYPDVTRHTAVVNRPIRHPDDMSYIRHDGYSGFPLESGLMQTGIHQQIHYLNVYKPPPPYPSNGLASNSTPDLAIASQSISPVGYHRGYISSQVSGSSPDLVSSRTFLSRQYLNRLHGGNVHNVAYPGMPQNVLPSAHGTYENLASIMDVPNRHIIIEQPHHLTNHIQKVYDDRGNIMYCMPATQVPYRSHMILQQHQKLNTVSDSQEPIYENVPLPWQAETTRDRAYSLNLAPEVNKAAERKVSQPISIMLNSNQAGVSGSFAGAFNQSVNVNHYVNAHVLKSNNNETQVEINERPSRRSDVQDITNSLQSISVSRDDEIVNANKVECNVSLKGSVTGLHIPLIQTSDNNNVTTITISTPEDVNQPFTFAKVNSGYFKRDKAGDGLHNLSEVSSQRSALDFTMPSSSFFDSTQQSSSYDLETSVNSSNASSVVPGKEKKKRRWGMFGGRSNKTEVKSATLGRQDKSKKNTLQDSNEKHRWSTALPKLQPLPPSISKEVMCQLLERKMVDTQLSFSFERIPKGRDVNTDMTTALLPENSHLNAGNIEFLPYEDNRVRLTPTKANKYGYINASHITATVGSSQRFYVACSVTNQTNASSPLSSAIFWQAVWEAGARVLAYISSNVSPDHLPELSPGRTKDYGQYQVFVESSQASDYVVISRLRVINGKGNYSNMGTIGQMRTIWHLQYIEWPDSITVPKSTEHFLGFLEELSAVRQHCASEITPLHNANPPVFVACLQGAGRTGVTIASDLLLYTLEHNQELDIPRVISLLHQQRANLLQNVHQYRFIHGLLIHYLKQTRLI
ncbi:protein tyrosine phosphatase non-receptor pez [Arctopsyche grandis]|uniref:protein tyrosine phosphatase non-receptor pez n=1 Tax=Arctopsyche grandis TaxID=121162 RepID=UPI00406D828E